MRVTKANYYGKAANKAYMSVSQFKSFLDCEARTMAELEGEYKRPMTKALMVGSYVDAYFEGTLSKFKQAHPEIFKRDGELKAEYAQANEIIKRVKKDDMFKAYMSGKKQKIVTAEMFGTPWKIKIDSLCDDKIVDLKCMANLKWGYDVRNNRYTNFVELWHYDLQLAVYQEIFRKKYKKQLPVFIAACTKEDPPDLEIISIPQWRLNECLEEVERAMPHILDVKAGKVEPKRCGVCAYCRQTKKLTAPVDFEMVGLNYREREEF